MGSVLGTLSALDVVLLTAVAVFILQRLWRRKQRRLERSKQSQILRLPPLKKKDYTLEELKQYDGSSDDGRILLAVESMVFDVTPSKHLYAKDGPYGIFAGRDASRGLALLQTDLSVIKEEYDDLSDLTSSDMENLHEWTAQFKEKYAYVGRLLKAGEEPDIYDDDGSSRKDHSVHSTETDDSMSEASQSIPTPDDVKKTN